MTKKIISLFALLLLLGAPTMIIADEAQNTNTATEEVVDLDTDIETDSYDVDGCYC